LPAPFLKLLGRNDTPAFIQEKEPGLITLSSDLPGWVMKKIKDMNDSRRLTDLIERLYDTHLFKSIDPDIISGLLEKTGRTRDMAELEIDQAKKALKNGEQSQAMEHLWHVVKQLYGMPEDPEHDPLFISATLKLSDLCFSLGTGFMELPRFLKKARLMAQKLGDRRSHALIHLNLSIFLHIAGQHDDSLSALSEGLKEVQSLGDEDILSRSAAFIGLNFFLQGMFRDAESFLERATLDYELQGGESMTMGPLPMPFLLGYCLANLGYFHDAVGGLECSWRMAANRSQEALATTIRTILGTVLQMAGKREEALFHLESASREAQETQNSFAMAIADGGLIYQAFIDGHLENARNRMDNPAGYRGKEGFLRLYTAPHILEMIFEMESMGAAPHPRLNFGNELSWIQKAPNIHAKGALFRLLARDAMTKGEEKTKIVSFLEKSEACIKESGDPVELAKIWLEKARHYLLMNETAQARKLTQRAYRSLTGHRRWIFPDDMLSLVKKEDKAERMKVSYSGFLSRFMEIFETKSHGESVERILAETLKNACRLFSAERGGIFRLDEKKPSLVPVLWSGHNLTPDNVLTPDFAPGREVVQNVLKRKEPLSMRLDGNQSIVRDQFPIKAVLCLPLLQGSDLAGVFYFDNIYLDNDFDLMDQALLTQMAAFMSDYVAQRLDYTRLQRETSIWSSARTVQIEQLQREELLFQSPVMKRLLSQSEKVAETDSTLLIQGETGVGKELLARQLHKMSTRNSGPFEVVDLTAIPESLLESELFGYEKGAFTGAERQKRGRFELTRKGTLFLDEIGEIPLSFQVKLLRVLQEKTFVRVGGTKTLASNFRLIVATNRDLAEEVKSGRFRQDLFYRLNMMPLTVPPLRDREDDIVLLARHFLGRYAAKHNKSALRLIPEDEAVLKAYPWPGNVRELKNVMERAVLLSRNGRLDFGQLNPGSFTSPTQPVPSEKQDFMEEGRKEGDTEHPSLEEYERRYIRQVLEKSRGKISGRHGACEILGIKRTTLYSRMKKLGIEKQTEKY
jgi:transcriptional regulator with GAF, ATPase, and Fis domain/tetratricopeptide (TPR) repeat protein